MAIYLWLPATVARSIRVTPDGKGVVFFRTEETHARSLAMDSKDNVIVGTEPGGLILRISPQAKALSCTRPRAGK